MVGDLLETLRAQTAREVIHVRDGALDRPGVLVCDAEDDDDLARIAADGPAGAVWAGSAGLAGALFRGLEPGGGAPPARRAGRPGARGRRHAGRRRAARGAARAAGLHRHPGRPAARARRRAWRWRAARMRCSTGRRRRAPTSRARVEHAAGLVLTGGETARAVCDRVGVTAIELIREIEPGVPLGRAGDLGIVTKAGAFGDPGTLSRAVDAIRGEA